MTSKTCHFFGLCSYSSGADILSVLRNMEMRISSNCPNHDMVGGKSDSVTAAKMTYVISDESTDDFCGCLREDGSKEEDVTRDNFCADAEKGGS